jgi:rubrerythrin
MEAMAAGMKVEKQSIELYTEAANATSNSTGKAMFERLARVETDHLFFLQAEYDYLSRAGVYFGMAELSPATLME